ncbi:oligosaccharide flippase family protein [Phyllobacterium leguminum]|uniref:PST family polysaccharide transporter n=1 Tax=Phyllobacterium leguminum TaxID=314237 RepID=A0A318T0W1_9HYPH|nr:oligosaccharide flippase family protein [Phyllobacterium leguminum]PYE87289.1 PST family polysaccharide transporter [Phyllobacterium leguminum]
MEKTNAEDTVSKPRRGVKHALLNIGSLAAIQVANAVSPLIIYPFLLAVVGSEGYAQVALAEALSLFLLTFVIYSFDIDGVAEIVGISPVRDKKRISVVHSEILMTRIAFYAIGLCILEAAVLLINPQLSMLVLQWSLVSLAYAIQPTWLFQALERNLPLAIISLISRAGAVITIVMTIRQPGDYAFVPGIIGIWYLAGAVIAAGYALRKFGLTLEAPAPRVIASWIWRGKEVFLSNVGVTLYRDANVLLLGIFGVPSTGIAAYSVAEKLVKAIQASIRPVNQFFFPRALAVAKANSKPSRAAFMGIFRITMPQVAVVLCIVAGVFGGYWILGSSISAIAQIKDIEQVAGLAAIMSLACFPGVANFMFGSAGLNALGARSYLLVAVMFTGIASIAVNLCLIPVMGVTGSAICFVLAETLLLALIARRYFVY